MSNSKPKLLIAASGTGGHLFPALAVAENLPDYDIQWLGVANRLETTLVPQCYKLHTIDIEGFQTGFGLKTFLIIGKMIKAIAKVRQLIKENHIEAIFTTGGYIAAPTIIGAKLEQIPVILHESNLIPGKVTKWAGNWCDTVAIGFEDTVKYLPKAKTKFVSTPVRNQFLSPQLLNLEISDQTFLIVVMGGSQGAVALNKLVRKVAKNWLDKGITIVHLTGKNDTEIDTLQHDNYIVLPFYENMAGLLQRANLAISRSGAGTLTELAITKTPSILIPYPFAAEDHQYYNAKVFADRKAAYLFREEELTPEILNQTVLGIFDDQSKLQLMSENTASLALKNSSEIIAKMITKLTLPE